ncbi:MAG: NAD(P)H-binding protein [Planctomycetota bacterium]
MTTSEHESGTGPTDGPIGGPMRVAVTGATGFVGRYLVGELLGRGHHVLALVRDERSAMKLLGELEGAEERLEVRSGAAVFGKEQARGVDRTTGRLVKLGETEDGLAGPPAGSAAALLSGIDAMVHLIGIIREASDGQTFERIHVELTRNVLAACRAAGVARYVHMSALGVTSEGPAEYQKTKAEAERLVRDSGLDWTIFRPGIIHGHGSSLMEMIAGWARGSEAPWAVMPYFQKLDLDGVPMPPPAPEDPLVQPVAVEDVAYAFAESLETPDAIGELYNLGGPDTMTMPEMLAAYRERIPEAKPNQPIVGIPGIGGSHMAIAAKLVGLRDLLPFDSGMALMAAQDTVCDLDKARAHLGFEPMRFTDALDSYAAAL